MAKTTTEYTDAVKPEYICWLSCDDIYGSDYYSKNIPGSATLKNNWSLTSGSANHLRIDPSTGSTAENLINFSSLHFADGQCYLYSQEVAEKLRPCSAWSITFYIHFNSNDISLASHSGVLAIDPLRVQFTATNMNTSLKTLHFMLTGSEMKSLDIPINSWVGIHMYNTSSDFGIEVLGMTGKNIVYNYGSSIKLTGYTFYFGGDGISPYGFCGNLDLLMVTKFAHSYYFNQSILDVSSGVKYSNNLIKGTLKNVKVPVSKTKQLDGKYTYSYGYTNYDYTYSIGTVNISPYILVPSQITEKALTDPTTPEPEPPSTTSEEPITEEPPTEDYTYDPYDPIYDDTSEPTEDVSSTQNPDITSVLNSFSQYFQNTANSYTQEDLFNVSKNYNFQLNFSPEYLQYMYNFGQIDLGGMNLTGLSSNVLRNVYAVTQNTKQYDDRFPSNSYVVEDLGYDGRSLISDETGQIYQYYNGTTTKMYDSLMSMVDSRMSTRLTNNAKTQTYKVHTYTSSGKPYTYSYTSRSGGWDFGL